MKHLEAKFKNRNWILAIYGILALPSVFLGFDQHHGGLIHATLTTTRTAFFNHDALPFNQYGSFWVFFFGIFYLLVPPNYAFLAIKILTYFLSAITLFLTYKFAIKYLDRVKSYFVVIIMVATYPFYSGNLPWPSTLTMLTIPLIGILLCHIEDNGSSLIKQSKIFTFKNDRLALLVLGFLVTTVFQTRVQIGFLLLIFLIYYFSIGYFRQKSLYRNYFLIGFIGPNLSLYLVFFLKGWVRDSLSDQFIFGASYITGDKSTYPIPKWTILLTISFTVFYFLLHKIKSITMPNSFNFSIYIFFLLSLIVYVYEISIDNQRFNLITLIAWKRFWISLLLASTLIYSIRFIKYRLRSREAYGVDSKRTILVGLSLISLLQTFPLFDEMHAWWGSTPGFILVILALDDIRKKINGDVFPKIVLVSYILFSLVIAAQTTGEAIAHSGKSQFANGLKGVFIDKENLQSQLSISKFLEENIPKKAKVLNLCTNANVFFESVYHSASRSIVFWTPIYANSNLREEILRSKPDRILTCSTTTNPKFEKDYLLAQKEALNGISIDPKLTAAMTDPKGGEWKIWIP